MYKLRQGFLKGSIKLFFTLFLKMKYNLFGGRERGKRDDRQLLWTSKKNLKVNCCQNLFSKKIISSLYLNFCSLMKAVPLNVQICGLPQPESTALQSCLFLPPKQIKNFKSLYIKNSPFPQGPDCFKRVSIRKQLCYTFFDIAVIE